MFSRHRNEISNLCRVFTCIFKVPAKILTQTYPIDDSGNNLVEETDARGNKTAYTVDSYTSRNEEVIDRLGNKTAYEYDDSGRTTKVTSIAALRDENGNIIKDENDNIQYETAPKATVSYSYDTFDNMTEIVRGDGMKYALAYNEFHNLESIGIEGKDEKLISYKKYRMNTFSAALSSAAVFIPYYHLKTICK